MSKQHSQTDDTVLSVIGPRGFSAKQRRRAREAGIRVRRLGKAKTPDFEPVPQERGRPSIIVYVVVQPVEDGRMVVGYDIYVCYRAYGVGGKLKESHEVAARAESVFGVRRPTVRYYLLGNGRAAFNSCIKAVMAAAA